MLEHPFGRVNLAGRKVRENVVMSSLTQPPPPARYADPLMPRRQSAAQGLATSQNFSPEAEKQLQGLIAEIKSSSLAG